MSVSQTFVPDAYSYGSWKAIAPGTITFVQLIANAVIRNDFPRGWTKLRVTAGV
jgi:hypothetical protein